MPGEHEWAGGGGDWLEWACGNSVLAFRSFRTHTATRPDRAGPGQDNVVITAPGHVFAVSPSRSFSFFFYFFVTAFFSLTFPGKTKISRKKYRLFFVLGLPLTTPKSHPASRRHARTFDIFVSVGASLWTENAGPALARPMVVRKGNSRGAYYERVFVDVFCWVNIGFFETAFFRFFSLFFRSNVRRRTLLQTMCTARSTYGRRRVRRLTRFVARKRKSIYMYVFEWFYRVRTKVGNVRSARSNDLHETYNSS